ncbi:hypothetical protein EDB87DRAFT_1263942 [Lactarius vividus]|nr:hypothetical protein EDB87DRAFT_1263942 [Lactarius vividus]
MCSKHSWAAVGLAVGPPPNDTTIDLYVALKSQGGENALVEALCEVSTPCHSEYGIHLSREQAAKLVALHPCTLEPVHSWLEYCGIPSSSISVTNGGGALKRIEPTIFSGRHTSSTGT